MRAWKVNEKAREFEALIAGRAVPVIRQIGGWFKAKAAVAVIAATIRGEPH